jgi:hypothetical protein
VRRSALSCVLALAVPAAPVSAQRRPDRFGPPMAARWTSVAGPGSLAGAALGPGSPSRAAQRSDSTSGTRHFVSQALVGSVGSLAGLYLGAVLGDGYYHHWGEPCNCDDPGLMQALTGAALGSIVGTAIGTHVGARVAGGEGGHWGERLGAAAIGLLAGLGAYAFLHVDPDRQPAVALVIPVTQAVITALATPSR